MATAHAHLRHAFATSTTYDVPSSPTLTNPDMILPWRADDSSPTPIASSPTIKPDFFSLMSPRSPVYDETFTDAVPEVGIAKAVVMPYRIKPSPPTTIGPSYQSYDHGAPLSVIGEEENTPKSRRTRSGNSSPSKSPTRPPGTKMTHTKRLSGRSDSSHGSDIENWEEFDSSRMMNERLAKDVANAGDDLTDVDGPDSRRTSAITITDDEMATLNRRAERILANAKKRLTHMEDNLSKARSTILVSPKSSPNMGDFHQPVGGLYRSISQGGDRRLGQGHNRKPRQLYPVVRTNQIGGHSRGLSETSIYHNSSPLSQSPQIRSASAMEYGHTVDSTLPDRSPMTQMNGRRNVSNPSYYSQPARIVEEEYGLPSSKPSPENTAPRGLGITSGGPQERPLSQASTRELREQMSGLRSKIADLKFKTQQDNLRRQGGHGIRTPSPFTNSPEQWYAAAPEYKEGGTPINTNAGLGWSPSQGNGPTDQSPGSSKSLRDSAFGDGEILIAAPALHQAEAKTDIKLPNLSSNLMSSPTGPDEIKFLPESHYEDAPEELEDGEDRVAASEEEQIYLNEVLEESLQDMEPDMPIVLEEYLTDGGGQRHEDRLDAFDYENMFLHSALGNYSQEGYRSRSNSDSSVETRRATTRTPVAEDEDNVDIHDNGLREEEEDEEPHFRNSATNVDDEPATPRASILHPPTAPWMKAVRSNSMDSVSTSATFETAMEEGQVDSEVESDTFPTEILNWGNQVSQPTPAVSGPLRPAWPTPPMSSSRPQSRGKVQMQRTKTKIENSLPTPPSQSPKGGQQSQQPPQHHPANTEILMASLITLADPGFLMPTTPNTFAEIDKGLVISLLRAVGGVCEAILGSEARGQADESRMWRARLDGARKVLDGSWTDHNEEGNFLD